MSHLAENQDRKLNSLENILLDVEQKRTIQRLTEQIQDPEEQALQCMDALLPRYHITIGTVLCPGTCQDCNNHVPILFEARKKTDTSGVYLFCFMCWWKSIGCPWSSYAVQSVTGMTVKPA